MISASEARKKAYNVRILTVKDEIEKTEELINKSAGEGRNRCEVYVKEKQKQIGLQNTYGTTDSNLM